IEDLVAGKDIRLVATAYGTDCYPRKKLETPSSLQLPPTAIRDTPFISITKNIDFG
ncbi:unnamed protein product, partial [marine sediment metagenome]